MTQIDLKKPDALERRDHALVAPVSPHFALLPIGNAHTCRKPVRLPRGNAARYRFDRSRRPIRASNVQARSRAGFRRQRPCVVWRRRRRGVRPGIAFRSRLAGRWRRRRLCRRRVCRRRSRRGWFCERRWTGQRRRMTYRVTCRRGLLRQACCRHERQRYCGKERDQSHRYPPSESCDLTLFPSSIYW